MSLSGGVQCVYMLRASSSYVTVRCSVPMGHVAYVVQLPMCSAFLEHSAHLAALCVVVERCHAQCMAYLWWPCMVLLEGQELIGWTLISIDGRIYLHL